MTGTPIANAAALQVSYKAYTDSTITPGVEPTPSTDPGATGAQILRRTQSSLNFAKKTFASAEIVTHRQVPDFRHGNYSVAGSITGELSPLTYQDLIAAACRGSWVTGATADNTTMTSLAATAASSKFTVAASTWAAKGFRVGDIFRPATVAAPNNGQNFLITALNGVDAIVYPAPVDMVADTTFSVAVPGRKVFPPLTSLVIPKFAFEHYYDDVNIAHLFTECRISSMKVTMPASGMPTAEFAVMGRNINIPGSPPFFTSPTAITSTTELTTFGGQLMVGGTSQAIITAADFTIDLGASNQDVAFSPLTPEIFTGVLKVTGTVTALFLDNTHLNDFVNETIFDLALTMTTANSRSADFISFYFGQVKYTGASFANSGYAGVPVTLPFQAYLRPSSTGVDASTLTIIDSLSA